MPEMSPQKHSEAEDRPKQQSSDPVPGVAVRLDA